MTAHTADLPLQVRVVRRAGPALRVGAIALLAAWGIGVAFAGFVSWDLVLFLLASTIFGAALVLARPFSGAVTIADRKAFLASALVVWIFLMSSEGVFAHAGSTDNATSGNFAAGAYYEAASWILSLAALVIISCSRPEYLKRLFTGPLKWASIFAVIAVLSCPLSPGPAYSLAQAFKLGVVVLALFAINGVMNGEATILTVLAALFTGTFLVTMAGFIAPFVGPGQVFNGTRFGAVIGLSGTAGILLLLSLLFWLLKRNPWFLLAAAFSIVLMIMAGGKGGIVASVLSLMMFFFLLKKAGQALLACVAITIVFLLLVAFTPVGNTLQSYGESSTLSGRTNLWAAVWPEIEHKPILGHGYRASRFVSAEVEGTFAEAGHIHNAFLEILYNNGVIGLLPILITNAIIVANLGRALNRPATLRARYYTAGTFALYMHLLLWGVTAPTFGGTADSRFMVFFGVLLISVHLKSHSAAKSEAAL
jgi:O-antigen ligase